MSEQYRENVQKLCKRLSLSNPICEEALFIRALTFYTRDRVIRIDGTEMNRAGRLFFQERLATDKAMVSVQISTTLTEAVAEFFAENWHDADEKGRAMLIAFKQAYRFRIHWK
jgi:hypothetical protein